MALTLSTMLPLGTVAPDFTLFDVVSQKKLSLQTLKSNTATVILFICNHCPFVKHLQHELVRVIKKYQQQGISFIAINSNNVDAYPEDSPEKMAALAQALTFSFPYLYDETQDVARAYHAACTPDIYVFDKTLSLVYRGRFDASTPGNQLLVTGKDLCDALDAVLANTEVSQEQHPSQGCNIKWK